ncbi:hypothetical protein GGS21DRAFT_292493 [Xylaria nigripes]|nr:hypothetical protein GGS21DRAFT_292493 [Xylaria nigripes]
MASRSKISQDLASTASTSQAPVSNATAGLDASTNDLKEIETLTVLYKDLAREVRGNFYQRMQHYTEFKDANPDELDDEGREEKMATMDKELEEFQKQSVELGERKRAVISKLPPQLRAQSMRSIDMAVAELEIEFLQIEEQRLLVLICPVLTMADQFDAQLHRAQSTLGGIQSPTTRAGLETSIGNFQEALHNFRFSFRHYGRKRANSITQEFARLDASLSDQPHSSDDEASDDDDTKASTSSSVSSVEIRSAMIPISKKVGEFSLSAQNEDAADDDSMLNFDRNSPPNLQRLAGWLGLDSDISTAVLLNSGPIQDSYAAYRASPGESCAVNPEGLKNNMPLFTYTRETLLQWQYSMTKLQHDGLNFSAAVFAHQVVRFLEGSCEEVDWKPVSNNIRDLSDYKVARCHWAVALQIFWYMEKTFA